MNCFPFTYPILKIYLMLSKLFSSRISVSVPGWFSGRILACLKNKCFILKYFNGFNIQFIISLFCFVDNRLCFLCDG